MHHAFQSSKSNIIISCILTPFVTSSCGVAKKEDKNKSALTEFKSVAMSSSISTKDLKASNAPMTIEMSCKTLGYHDTFTVGGTKPFKIDIPLDTNCNIKIISFEINSIAYTYQGTNWQLDTEASKNKISYKSKNEQFLYKHKNASAFLMLKVENNKINIHVSEFFGATNAGYAFDNEIHKLKFDKIEHASNIDLSNVGSRIGWRIIREDYAEYWYLLDFKKIPDQSCKVYFNTKALISNSVQIHEIDKAYHDTDSIPCEKYIIDTDSGTTTFTSDSSKIINDELDKDIFLIFKDTSNVNLPKYGLIKKEKEDKFIDSISENTKNQLITKIKDFKEINSSNLSEAESIKLDYELKYKFLEKKVANTKFQSSKFIDNIKTNIKNIEDNLKDLSTKISNYKNTIPQSTGD
ncbi:hypothetical protein [Pigmentibacter ruber]|uniref:hypothetical protein n=1 Tax=Pigmentibacter ruber TaxID=2683196 RepID=UPI00131E248D|nr:hypothetical protein [Pigmentibacter ruber]